MDSVTPGLEIRDENADSLSMSSERRHDMRKELLERLGAAREHDDPYAGADQANAGRIVALLWLLSAILTLCFFPLDPPTDAIGSAGWFVAGLLVAGSVVGARHLLRRDPPLDFNELLALSFLGLAQVALLEWLAGGADSVYEGLFILWVGSAMGIHPPRRAFLFLGATAVALALPLEYDGWSGPAAADIAAQFLLFAALGTIMLGLMLYVRGQRVRLRSDEAAAQQLARADPLTSMGNRRAFDEALGAEVARARRAHSTVSVALLDIDGFKALNDTFGHLEGDRLLRLTSGAIQRALRAGDRAFRWGGDEFALLLPDTDFAGAEEALARVAAGVMASCSAPDGRALTGSWGIAELDGEMTPSELLAQADLMLMGHKRQKATADRDEQLLD
jgi:diguanylate cyclase (GGDEF)-like protein